MRRIWRRVCYSILSMRSWRLPHSTTSVLFVLTVPIGVYEPFGIKAEAGIIS